MLARASQQLLRPAARLSEGSSENVFREGCSIAEQVRAKTVDASPQAASKEAIKSEKGAKSVEEKSGSTQSDRPPQSEQAKRDLAASTVPLGDEEKVGKTYAETSAS